MEAVVLLGILGAGYLLNNKDNNNDNNGEDINLPLETDEYSSN